MFGADGSVTQEMLDFIDTTSQQPTKTALGTVQAVVSGDIGLASPLAADSVSLALGGEYRKYTAALTADALSLTSGEIIGQIAIGPVSGRYDAKELFGELIAPHVQNRPFVHLGPVGC